MTGPAGKGAWTRFPRKRCLVMTVQRPRSPGLPWTEIAIFPEKARNRESSRLSASVADRFHGFRMA